MDEQFLHYVWRHQLFNTSRLTNNKSLTVFYPGDYNLDSGPDFKEARLKIDTIEWAGSVEIHIKSSDWFNHNHHTDEAYDNVVLHVVWQHDKEVRINNSILPTLELNNYVDMELFKRYKDHLQNKEEILCQNQLANVRSMMLSGMLYQTLVERLEEKATLILKELNKNKNDWEEISYKTIATNFGFSTNKDAFARLTELLPYKKLKKNLHNLKATEALLFGQAGFLQTPNDSYHADLKKEYDYLSKKYQLMKPMAVSQWKLSKLRPPNFPTVRLSQFASLLHHYPQLFSYIIETENIHTLKNIFHVTTSDYWHSHYDFGKSRKNLSKGMGNKSIEGVLLNSVVPILAAYSKFTADLQFMDRAILLLETISFETNRITRKFDSSVFLSKSAFDSQGLIQLFKNYCFKKKCLNCRIGIDIISNDTLN